MTNSEFQDNVRVGDILVYSNTSEKFTFQGFDYCRSIHGYLLFCRSCRGKIRILKENKTTASMCGRETNYYKRDGEYSLIFELIKKFDFKLTEEDFLI